MTDYNQRMVERSEARWLDPDYNTIPEDEDEWENYQLLKGDAEWAEKAVYST